MRPMFIYAKHNRYGLCTQSAIAGKDVSRPVALAVPAGFRPAVCAGTSSRLKMFKHVRTITSKWWHPLRTARVLWRDIPGVDLRTKGCTAKHVCRRDVHYNAFNIFADSD